MARRTKWLLAVAFDGFLASMIGAALYSQRKRTLSLDPSTRMVAVDSTSWSLDAIDPVGALERVCTGIRASLEEAAKRIRALQKEAR